MVAKQILRMAEDIYAIALHGQGIQERADNYGIARKADQSIVTVVDHEMEAKLMSLLKREYPAAQILSEEGGGTKNLDLEAAVQTGVFSVDPLDGTKLFAAGLPDWALSVAYLFHGRPLFAIVAQPGYKRLFAVERGAGVARFLPKHRMWGPYTRVPAQQQMLALDYAKNAATNAEHQALYTKLIAKYGFFQNKPSATAGLELMLGHTFAWVSGPTPHHWDPVAGALFIEECGGVAECLSGEMIPWGQATLPPLLFAESSDRAVEVCAVLGF